MTSMTNLYRRLPLAVLAFVSIAGMAKANSITFQLGAGSVIYGLDIGLQGLKVGGTRRLIIPSTFAYGSQGSGGIPPNSAIVFEVTLDSIQ